MYAKVIIDISAEAVDRPFTYIVPKELEDKVLPGMRVLVPFGHANTRKKGYVIALTSEPEIEPDKLKALDSVDPSAVTMQDRMIRLALHMSREYGATLNQTLKTVLPVKRVIRKNTRRTDPVQVIESYQVPVRDMVEALNEDQERAAEAVLSADKPVLLKGITGSGKTMVYIELIRRMRALGKSTIVLIPEISLTYQTVRELLTYLGGRVAVMHSKLSTGEKYEQFIKAMEGEIDVMVGPRSALFTPFENIGLVIIDEEHERSYISDTTPRYDAREVARWLAGETGARLVLGSATPSVESYYAALHGGYTLVRLDRRAVPGALLPEVHVTDMRRELKEGNRSMISRKLDGLIRERLEKKEKILLFLNRRGYAGFVSCRSCGYVFRCSHCDVSLTAHNDWYFDRQNGRKAALLTCHYCGYQMAMPEKCPECASPYIAPFGTGTQKLELTIKKLYPEASVLRMDADTTSAKNSMEKIITSFAAGNADILIGTQMIVKGHDFPKVTLVGIVAADMSLYAPDFTASERTFQLITQAAGRAGRGGLKGDVVIQTYDPSHYALQAAATQDYDAFYGREISYRQLMKYPPCSRMMAVTLSCADAEYLDVICLRTLDYLEQRNDIQGLQIIGPVQTGLYRLKDTFRKFLYIKLVSHDIISDSSGLASDFLILRENLRAFVYSESGGKVQTGFDIR